MKHLLSILILLGFMSVASAEILICDFENNGDGWSDGDRMILEREDNKFMEVGFPEEDGYHIDFEDEELIYLVDKDLNENPYSINHFVFHLLISKETGEFAFHHLMLEKSTIDTARTQRGVCTFK